MSLLTTYSLSKSFLFRGQLSQVLCEVDFEIDEGEFVSIIGTSGCGKTTFLELLAGISLPDNGEIRYEGKPITGKSGILGYMPQDDLLLPWLDTLGNILLPAKVQGKDLNLRKSSVTDLLPTFGLEEYSHHLPWQLSGGLKQRVALARTYMMGSKLMLLDEPLANLDAITRSSLQTWLKQIVDKLKLTVILVTHDIHEAILLSNRVVVMKQGRLVHNEPIQTVNPIDSDLIANRLRTCL